MKKGLNMPYYQWRGIMMDATLCKGAAFAPDKQALDELLLKQNISLLSCTLKRQIYLRPVSLYDKLFFFEHLQALLEAGLHMRQALLIISRQTSDARFAQIMYNMSNAVEHGQSLHDALQQYPWIFTQEMIATARIGAQVGNPAIALKALCTYLDASCQFKKRMRSILLLPACTLLLFLSILLVLLLVIVPRYAQLFASMGKQLPFVTNLLLKMSNVVSSPMMLGYMIVVSALVVLFVCVMRKPTCKILYDKYVLRIAYLGPLLQKIALVCFLQSLALLLKGGMPLVSALEIARRSIANTYLAKQVKAIMSKIQAGQMLSEAMQIVPCDFFEQDLMLLVIVGEQGACLDQMIERAARMYEQSVNQMLHRYLVIAQPLLIMILGCLVAALIFAIYMPLLNFADVI